MIAYALQGVIFLLLALIIVLMVRGVLYIREHLAPVPDSELPDGNMEPDDPAPPFQWKKLSERNNFKATRGASKA